MDEGFNAESEGSGEETELREEEEEDEERAQQAGDRECEEEEQAKQNAESINTEEEGGDEGERWKLNQNMVVNLVWDDKYSSYTENKKLTPMSQPAFWFCWFVLFKQNCT